jgi:hypothetical protein
VIAMDERIIKLDKSALLYPWIATEMNEFIKLILTNDNTIITLNAIENFILIIVFHQDKYHE